MKTIAEGRVSVAKATALRIAEYLESDERGVGMPPSPFFDATNLRALLRSISADIRAAEWDTDESRAREEFRDACEKFTREIVKDVCWVGGYLDGGDAQDRAVALGILKPCGDDCIAARDGLCECEEIGEGYVFTIPEEDGDAKDHS